MGAPVPIAELAEHAVAAGLAGEAEPATVYGRLMPALGLELGWDVALAWEVHEETDGPHLRCAADWAAAPAAAEPFVALSRALRLERGQGLPGRVWEGGEPVWLEDFGADRTLPRAVAAAPAGLRAALCLPTRAAGEVVGAIELLATDPRPPDAELLAVSESLGGRIGDYVERRRHTDAVRAGEASRR